MMHGTMLMPAPVITQQGIRDAEFQLANPDLFRLTHAPMRVRAQVQNSPYP